MSKKDAVLLVSRAMAVYLMFWILSDVAYLPERLFSFIHYARQEPKASPNNHYLREYYLVGLVFLVTRIVGLSILVRWFYKGGPGVEALLLPSTQEPESPSQSQPGTRSMVIR